jgi:hypothetical protein
MRPQTQRHPNQPLHLGAKTAPISAIVKDSSVVQIPGQSASKVPCKIIEYGRSALSKRTISTHHQCVASLMAHLLTTPPYGGIITFYPKLYLLYLFE